MDDASIRWTIACASSLESSCSSLNAMAGKAFSCTDFSSGLARKEDFPYITYYCPHCHALNKPKQLDDHVSGSDTPNMGFVNSKNMGSPITDFDEAVKATSSSAGGSTITNNSSVNASPEIEEVS